MSEEVGAERPGRGPAKKLYCSLSVLEISVYTATWICGVFYSLYTLYLAGVEQLSRGELRYGVEKLRPWWRTWRHDRMFKDQADHEWITWKISVYQIGIYVAFFPVFSWFTKRFFKDYSLIFNATYSIVVTGLLLGFLPLLYIFLLIGVMFLTYLCNSTILVWAVSISYILLLNTFPLRDMKDWLFPDYSSQMHEGYLTSVLLAWINARCVSFCLDRLWGRVEREASLTSGFFMLTAFCFYLPLGIMGPLVTSGKFKECSEQAGRPLNFQLLFDVITGSARYLLWIAVTEMSTYITFQQAFTYHPHIVSSMSLWALCGMGYAMGQFFHLKYVVMYGMSSHLARLDGMEAPGHPACIGRVHLYSDMWRYFDSGLYEFMRDYIYLPIIAFLPSSLFFKLMGSAICFSFVFVWHGTMDFVLIWSLLNFLGITLEGLARAVSVHPSYRTLEDKISQQMARRLHALLAAPLLVMSSLSNFYFFAGTQVGHIFVRRILLESWPIGMPTLLAFFYCCCQTSIEVKNYKIKNEILYGRNRKD